MKATEEQREYVKKLLNNGMGNRGNFDGDYFERLFGFIGQVIVCDLFGYPRPTDLNTPDAFFDLKIDGRTYDVKTVINDQPYKKTLHFLVAEVQIKYNVDAYIFVAYNKNDGTYKIAGQIDKSEFLKVAVKKFKGQPSHNRFIPYHVNCYEIMGGQLHSIKWPK